MSFDKLDFGIPSQETLHPVFAERLLVTVNNQDAAGKFFELSLCGGNSESIEMEDPARQQLLLLTREALTTFVSFGMRDSAIETVLQRGSWNVPSFSSRPLRSSLLNFTDSFLQVPFGVLGHLGVATRMAYSK